LLAYGEIRLSEQNIFIYFSEITKVMTKVSKEGGCEGVAEWIKPCGNHFYWSACSTHDVAMEQLFGQSSNHSLAT
jgi:hypothetical protein